MQSETSPKYNTPSRNSEGRGIIELIPLVIWVLLKKLLRLLLKCVLLFFIYIYRTILFLIKWWKDGDTKEKRAILWKDTCNAFSLLWTYIRIGLLWLWRGLVWITKESVNGLLHLRSTIVKLMAMIKKGCKTLKSKEFKENIRGKISSMKASITDFATEKNEERNDTEEEELLKEYEMGKNASVEKWINRINKYIE